MGKTNRLQISSVLDVGCGIGSWLSVFEKKGIHDVCGVDGAHVSPSMLLISKEKFMPADLSEYIPELHKKYDMTLCLEVAEHLPERSAEKLVYFICKSSDLVVFSAAVPGQMGENHINCQPPQYWENLFEQNNFVFLDIFRQTFWNNSKVAWWYRQNMFLAVPGQSSLVNRFPRFNKQSYIHPELFACQLDGICLRTLFWKRIKQVLRID